MAFKPVLLGLVLSAMAGAATAQEALNLQTDVRWLSKPSGDDMAAVYPSRAAREGLSARTVLACRVDRWGRLDACQVMAETPAGQGFDVSALKLANRFKMTPKLKDGRSVEGGFVMIPILFVMGGRPAPLPDYDPGGVAAVVTMGPAGEGTRPCPTETQPDRHCHVHKITWASKPSLLDVVPALMQSDQKQGVADMECSADAEGRLSACIVHKTASAKTAEIMLSQAAAFRAPPKADDGAPTTTGRIVILYDWAALTRAAQVIEAVRPTAAVPAPQ